MIYLIGSGGHAKVVLDALLAAGTAAETIRIGDGSAGRDGALLLGLAVVTPEFDAGLAGARFHIAIGSGAARRRLHEAACAAGGTPLTIRHPGATIAASASVGEGAFVAAASVIGPDARIGPATIVNHGAVVDHDCRVGAFSHIAPNATLGGGVSIGDEVLVGSGATILPGMSVGAGSVIGAGAVVRTNVGAGEQWTGVPAVKRADPQK